MRIRVEKKMKADQAEVRDLIDTCCIVPPAWRFVRFWWLSFVLYDMHTCGLKNFPQVLLFGKIDKLSAVV